MKLLRLILPIKYLLKRRSRFAPITQTFVDTLKRDEKFKNREISRINTIKKQNIIVFLKDIHLKNMEKINDVFIESGYTTDYIQYLFGTLNRIFEYMKSNGYLLRNPLKHYTLKRGRNCNFIHAISEKSLKKLETTTFKKPQRQFAVDMFVFSCHTGLSYTDLITSKYSEILRENGYWIVGNRNKNQQEYNIPLDKTALSIIKKYRKKQSGLRYQKKSKEYIFPYICRTTYTGILKSIQKELNIQENISAHRGRHTFATRMLRKGYSLESIKKMLGHSLKSDITWLYLEVEREKIWRETKHLKTQTDYD